MRRMSICFTWFPIGGYRRTPYITSIGLFYKNVGRLWRVSDCEELVGLLTGDDGAEMLISAFRSRRSISGSEWQFSLQYHSQVNLVL